MQKRTLKKLLLVCIILCLCFIWGQSLLPETKSAQESGYVTEQIVNPVEERLFGQATTTEDQVRKIAHVFEHMMLALGIAAYARILAEERNRKASVWIFAAFSIGIFTALIDETIQLFSGRGSLVSDVWIDGIGVILGIFIVWLIGRIRRRNRRVKTECTTL